MEPCWINFNLLSNEKNHSKFNNFCSIGSKISKQQTSSHQVALPDDTENKMRGQGLKIGRVKGAVKSKQTRGASQCGLAIYNNKKVS
jgi:hypothetical protein